MSMSAEFYPSVDVEGLAAAARLAAMCADNFTQFAAELSPDVIADGPSRA
jgi:hypothetical protein